MSDKETAREKAYQKRWDNQEITSHHKPYYGDGFDDGWAARSEASIDKTIERDKIIADLKRDFAFFQNEGGWLVEAVADFCIQQSIEQFAHVERLETALWSANETLIHCFNQMASGSTLAQMITNEQHKIQAALDSKGREKGE